jgi:transcriptional regulator NrdR family protein
MAKSVNLIKHSGDVVPFDRKKLIHSLQRARASDVLIQQIVEQVEHQIQDGMTTKKVYQLAFTKSPV